MKITSLSALASSIALVGGLLVAAPAVAAEPAHGTVSAAAKTLSVKKVDVDGDGRKDTVTVARVAKDRYKVTVKTARKRTASYTLTSTIASDWGIGNPYWGAARIDGKAGYDLLVATGGGDGSTNLVLTWRKNRLVREGAPQPRDASAKYSWYTLGTSWGSQGYRFYVKNGKRYVEAYSTWLNDKGTGRIAAIVTSKWGSSGWAKVSTRKVSLTASQAKKYPGGFTGVSIVAKS